MSSAAQGHGAMTISLFRHSTLCAINSTGHRGPCTCEVVESDREANRPGDATNAPGHDTEEVTSMPDKPNPPGTPRWYDVTFRGTAEMTVRVLADTPDEARMRAEDGYYDDASEVAFVKGKPYTLKVKVAAKPEVEL